MSQKPIELPADELAEAQEKERRACLAEIALRQARLADARAQADTEAGETGGAYWESRLCLKWVRQWRQLTE